MTEVAQVVVHAVLDLVQLRVPTATEIRLDHELVRDLALGSLDLAELATSIEVKLNRSLFDGVAMTGFLTVGELVEFCEQVKTPGSP